MPLRVLVGDFEMSASQRRLARKNADIGEHFGPLRFSRRVYDIYCDHSRRFEEKTTDPEDFISSFYTESCPSLQSEYTVDGNLAAVGFLDHSNRGLSSVYFVYDTAYSERSLGNYSVIREINHARELGLSYYYLGYHIAECGKMAYKNRFKPYEIYHWDTESWKTP